MFWLAPQHILRLRSPDVVPAMQRRPVLCGLVVTLRAFGTLLLIEKAKEVPAAVSPRVSARRVPLRPDEAFECCGSVHRRGSSAHVLSSQSFALRHVVPLTGYLTYPQEQKCYKAQFRIWVMISKITYKMSPVSTINYFWNHEGMECFTNEDRADSRFPCVIL